MKKDKDFQKMIEGLSKTYLNKVLKTLHQLIKDGDIKNIYTESHKLKGSGKTYGFSKISIASSEIEKLCEQFLNKKTDHLQKNKNLLKQKIKQLKSLTEAYQGFNIK